VYTFFVPPPSLPPPRWHFYIPMQVLVLILLQGNNSYSSKLLVGLNSLQISLVCTFVIYCKNGHKFFPLLHTQPFEVWLCCCSHMISKLRPYNLLWLMEFWQTLCKERLEKGVYWSLPSFAPFGYPVMGSCLGKSPLARWWETHGLFPWLPVASHMNEVIINYSDTDLSPDHRHIRKLSWDELNLPGP
jgi:hypothetical protein